MKRFIPDRSTAALAVSIVALIAAVGGQASAGPARTAKAKKSGDVSADKKLFKKLAKTASVAHATTAVNATTAANANALQGHSATAFASSTHEAWHQIGAAGEPAFQSGIVNFGGAYSTAAFYKDSLGIVHLKGTMDHCGGQKTAFTLPPGYRPSENYNGGMADGGGAGNLTILTDGEVQPYTPGTSDNNCGIDGTTFTTP